MGIHWTEIVFGVATFCILTAYHIYWFYRVRHAPLQTGFSRKPHSLKPVAATPLLFPGREEGKYLRNSSGQLDPTYGKGI